MISEAALEAVGAEELAQAARLFGELKGLRVKVSGVPEAALEGAFEAHVHGVLEKLEERLPQLAPGPVRAAEVAIARHGLLDASFLQAIMLGQAITPVLGDCLQQLRLAGSGFLMDMQQSVVVASQREQEMEQELDRMRSAAQALEARVSSLTESGRRLEKDNDDLRTQINQLRGQVRELEMSNAHPSASATSPRSSPLNSSSQNGFNNNSNISNNNNNNNNNNNPNSNSSNSNSISASKRSTLGASRSSAKQTPLSPSGTHAGREGVSGPMTAAQRLSIFRADIQRAIDEGRCRHITLNETVDTIERMYESKAAANEKARNGVGGVPMETMEQHVYRAMEKKYGLRGLAIEHAGNFVFALQRFQYDNNDAATFYKIFSNAIEEDFQLTMKELKRSIRDLLTVQLMTRHPTKDQSVVSQLLETKMGGYVTEDEWVDMMNYLYNETDSAAISLILKKLAKDEMEVEETRRLNDCKSPLTQLLRANSAPVNTSNNDNSSVGSAVRTRGAASVASAGARGRASTSRTAGPAAALSSNNSDALKLRFTTFLKAVLDFQLKSHEDYVAPIRDGFHRADENTDGVLSTEQFFKCFKFLQSPDAEAFMFPAGSPHEDLNIINRLSLSDRSREEGEDAASQLTTFSELVRALDPLETDVITYTDALVALMKAGIGK